VRDRIGREWGMPGPMVDEYPHTWVKEKLELMTIEGKARPAGGPSANGRKSVG